MSDVTSTVEVQGVITVRTYSDGAVQRNVWETIEQAQEYADSVAALEPPVDTPAEDPVEAPVESPVEGAP
jgi:hypothetical protein